MDILNYKEPITKIYFVRHGQTRANKLRLLFGKLDWDLTKEGIKQAKRAARNIFHISRKEKVHYLISSPLRRAKHTAQIISKKINLNKIFIDNNIIEKSEGAWEGKSLWEVRKGDPINYKKWLKNPVKNKPPQGESILDLNKRVKKFYKKVLKKYLGKSVIVVAHSGPIKAFILNVLGTNLNKFWSINVECGSITEIHLSKKHVMVWGMNRD